VESIICKIQIEMENENEEIVPINISNKMIANQKSYNRSGDYRDELLKNKKSLEARLNRLKTMQRNLYNMVNSERPSNEFFRNNRVIQQKIYTIEEELFIIKQKLRDFYSTIDENIRQTFGDIGTLPIVRGRIHSNEYERAVENGLTNGLTHIGTAKQFPKRLPLGPNTGKRQTRLGEFYSTISKTNTKRLRTKGGKQKKSKQRKSRRTMKKRN